MQLPAGTTVTSIGDGSRRGWFSLALTSDGEMPAWGDNSYSQLGIASPTRSTVPAQVRLTNNAAVTVIAAGDDHTMALTSTGRVLACEYNR